MSAKKLISLIVVITSMLVIGCEQKEEDIGRTSVSGKVVDGPVAGSRVFVSTCFTEDTAIISSVSLTDKSGYFRIEMNDDVIDGLYCAVAVGGEYLNMATGEIEVLPANTQMYTPFLYEEGVDIELAITPLTTLIYEMTEHDVDRGLNLVASYSQASAFVSESLAGIDPIHTVPLSASDSPSSETATQDQANYMAVLLALESYSERLSPGITPLNLVAALATDYVDGSFNGYTVIGAEILPVQLNGHRIDGPTVWLGIAKELQLQIDHAQPNSEIEELSSNILTFTPATFAGFSAGDSAANIISQYQATGINNIASTASGNVQVPIDQELLQISEIVEVYLDGELIGSATGHSDIIHFDSAEFEDGQHEINYSVRFLDGTVREYFESFVVNNTSPYVSTPSSHINTSEPFSVAMITNGVDIASVYLGDTPLSISESGSVLVPPLVLPEGSNEIDFHIRDALGNEFSYTLPIVVDTQRPVASFDYSVGYFLLEGGEKTTEYLDNAYLLNEPLIIGGSEYDLSVVSPSEGILDVAEVPYVAVQVAEPDTHIDVETMVEGTTYSNTYRVTESRNYEAAIALDSVVLGDGWLNYYDLGRTKIRYNVVDPAGNKTTAEIDFNSVLNDEVVEIRSNVIGGQVNVYDYINGSYSIIGTCVTNEFGTCRLLRNGVENDLILPNQDQSFLYVEVLSGVHQDPYTGVLTDVGSTYASSNGNAPLRALVPASSATTPALSTPRNNQSVMVDTVSSIFTSLALSYDNHSGTLGQSGVGAAGSAIQADAVLTEYVGTNEALRLAEDRYQAIFGFSPLNTASADLTDESLTSISDGVERALLLGAISSLSMSMGDEGNSLLIADAIADDLADGEMDGIFVTGIQGTLPSGESLQEGLYQGRLVEAIIEFSNSASNRTGIQDQALFDYALNVSSAISSELNSSVDPTVADPINYGSSLVTFDIASGASISANSVLYANISDVLDVEDVNVSIDGQSLPAEFVNGRLGIELSDAVSERPSGSYEITVDLNIAGTDEDLRVIRTISVDNENPEYILEYTDASFISGDKILTDSLQNLGVNGFSLAFSSITSLQGVEKTVEQINRHNIPYLTLFVSDNTGVAAVNYRFTVGSELHSGGLLRDGQRYLLPLDLNYLVSDGYVLGDETMTRLQVNVVDLAGNTTEVAWEFGAVSHAIIGKYETFDVSLGSIEYGGRAQLDNVRRATTRYSFINSSSAAIYLTLEDDRIHEAYETFDTAIRLNRAYIETAFRLRKRNLLSDGCDPEWGDWVGVNRLYNYELGTGRELVGWESINSSSSMSNEPHDVYADDGIFQEWKAIDPGYVFSSGDRNYDLVTDTNDRTTASYWGCSGENYAQSQNAQIYHSIEGYPRNEVGVEVEIYEFETVEIVVFDNTVGERIPEIEGRHEVPPGHSITISKVVAMPDMEFHDDQDVDDIATFRSYVLHKLDSSLLWQISRPIDVGIRVEPNGRLFQQTLGDGYTTYLLRRPGTF